MMFNKEHDYDNPHPTLPKATLEWYKAQPDPAIQQLVSEMETLSIAADGLAEALRQWLVEINCDCKNCCEAHLALATYEKAKSHSGPPEATSYSDNLEP